MRTPEYYILATNVFLSSVADVGGKDILTRHLSLWTQKLGIKGFRIWDADQIRVYLDGAEDIRRSYVAWITPSDVLAEVLDQLRIASPDFLDTMVIYLQKELTAVMYVNLEQAGHAPEARTLLAKVFVDLPISKERYSPRVPSPPGENQNRIVRMIVETGNEKLDPASALTQS